MLWLQNNTKNIITIHEDQSWYLWSAQGLKASPVVAMSTLAQRLYDSGRKSHHLLYKNKSCVNVELLCTFVTVAQRMLTTLSQLDPNVE